MAAEDLMLVGVRGEEMEPDDWLWPDPAPKVWQHLSLSTLQHHNLTLLLKLLEMFLLKRKPHIAYSSLAWWWSDWQVVGSIPYQRLCLCAWHDVTISCNFFCIFPTQTRATSALDTCSCNK